MLKQTFTSVIPCTAEALYQWHLRPGAFQRLTPPWEPVRLLAYPTTLEAGSVATLAISPLPSIKGLGVQLLWKALHQGFVPSVQFEDVQQQGPFAYWHHTHRFTPTALQEQKAQQQATVPCASTVSETTLSDALEYRLPLGVLGQLGGGGLVQVKLERMFRYRHQITVQDLTLHGRYGLSPKTVLVSGSSGLLGQALCAFLRTGGHRVIQLLRPESPQPVGILPQDVVRWNFNTVQETGKLLENAERVTLEGLDAVVHLGGAGIAEERWSPERKQRLWNSRVKSTQHLVALLETLQHKPSVFISASGTGVYPSGQTLHTEQSPVAAEETHFLQRLAVAWEQAAMQAETSLGCRAITLRLGVVLSPKAGFLAKLWRCVQLGVVPNWSLPEEGLSWVSVQDVLGAILHCLATPTLHAAVNVVSPQPCTYKQFWSTLQKVLVAPGFTPPVVRPLLGLLYGQLAEEALLSSHYVSPERLQQTGYRFSYPCLEGTLRHTLGLYTAEEALSARSC